MLAKETVLIFDSDEKAYQDWLHFHQDGFVVNTNRGVNPDYLVLHRPGCRLISQYNRMAQPGGFTERKYIKICSDDVEALAEWTENQGGPMGGFTKRCSFCF